MSPTRPRTDPQVVDLPALRAALQALKSHHPMIAAALQDLGLDAQALADVRSALGHILIDDFRSTSTRGGS